MTKSSVKSDTIMGLVFWVFKLWTKANQTQLKLLKQDVLWNSDEVTGKEGVNIISSVCANC